MLPALPSLRGLSKAIRGAEIAGVVVGVALRLRSLRFKDMDKRPMLRCGINARKGKIEEGLVAFTNGRGGSHE